MTERLIHGDDYPIPHPPMLAFLKANGLDPNNILAADPLTVQGGNLTVTQIERRTDGSAVLCERDGEDHHVAASRRSVPLKSPPEDHGL